MTQVTELIGQVHQGDAAARAALLDAAYSELKRPLSAFPGVPLCPVLACSGLSPTTALRSSQLAPGAIVTLRGMMAGRLLRAHRHNL